jgi:hypothetical protein
MRTSFGLLCVLSALATSPEVRSAEPLPGTRALTEEGDLAAKQVAGMHKYLDRALVECVEKRQRFWKPDYSSVAKYRKSLEPNRKRFRRSLGAVDPRLPPNLEHVGGPDLPALVAETDRYRVYAIRWSVLPGVDPKRIAFYGLSDGGKTAMRVPAVEKRYCLSICSGDFNEWIGKNVSVDLDRSYMWTGEYEMPEFDLGHTFNYAEMAYLIAPRPFMVERGHDDPVGTDEMVAYEYAKVRRLYAKLTVPDRTAIEWFSGGHQINAKGTFAFLKQQLDYPK